MSKDRDFEKGISREAFARKLRRVAEAVERGGRFEIEVGGSRIYIPGEAEFSIEHEREGCTEEIELQIRWAHE